MIDFKNIVNKSTLYNFHSHTQFCDGRDTMESIVKEAISQGFTHIGFTPHSPIPFPSSCNMSADNVPAYLNEIERLKKVYGDRINLYASMEIDYLDDWGAFNEYFSSIPLDYRLSSIHFIRSFVDREEFVDIDGCYENFREKMKQYFCNDIKSVVESFYRQTHKMIEAGGFDIIGHFDKIGYNASMYKHGIESEGWYTSLVQRTFEAIMDYGCIVEINTKAYAQRDRFFPNERFFHLLKEYKTPVLINSDVHYSHLINSGRNEAIKILNKN